MVRRKSSVTVAEKESDLFGFSEDNFDNIIKGQTVREVSVEPHYYHDSRGNITGIHACPFEADLDLIAEELDADLYDDDQFDDYGNIIPPEFDVEESYKDLKIAQIMDKAVELNKRWQDVPWTPKQTSLIKCLKRFITVAAGRRSGKTEIAKRKLVIAAIRFTAFTDGWFVAAAPTRDQAKRIFWRDLKALVPSQLVTNISESELTITLFNGVNIQVMGLDVPERIEGPPLDGIIIDEFASIKKETWTKHVRASLSTINREGWAILFGVPEGRNHFYDLTKVAKINDEWAHFAWPSSDVLPASEIASAKAALDELSFTQEYEASFVNFEGRAYYKYIEADHTRQRLPYNNRHDLIFCFDFNVSPGTATVVQEIRNENNEYGINVAKEFTGVINEVWIPTNSNTILVCKKLISMYPDHKGKILLYGDATGGARGSAKVEGSDWDLIKRELYAYYGRNNVSFKVPKANPRERARVNSTNTRIENTAGIVSMLVDLTNAPHLCEDYEGVRTVEGGSGELDKNADKSLTHLSDGLGYYIHQEHPIGEKAFTAYRPLIM